MSNNNAKTTKDSKYLKTLNEAIKYDLNHPKHYRVKMQAHHIISADGMKHSGIHGVIKEYKYDINHKKNLVFIPCTLQGACHLGVQVHRGNHDSVVSEENYIDDSEPKTYHEYVSDTLKIMNNFIKEHCVNEKKENEDKVIKKLNLMSLEVLYSIQYKPRVAPLTRIAHAFGKNGMGCGGVDSVTTHNSSTPCPVKRNHLFNNPGGSHGERQNDEGISFVPTTKFVLKPGR